MSDKYVLDESGRPVLEPDLMRWATWYEEAGNRRVALDKIGDVKISTVFLSIDHGFGDEGGPILWETMIFNGKHDGYQDRYTTMEDALEGHKKALELARDAA